MKKCFSFFNSKCMNLFFCSKNQTPWVGKLIMVFLILLGATPFMAQPAGSVQSLQSAVIKGLEYRCIGPTRGGRVTAVAGVASQPSVYYMGSTGGGVWKTEDHGINWKNISDGYFESPSIGAIRVAPSDPNTIYVGTGSDGIRSNIIAGKGMYKSVNAGKTWTFMGLKNTGQIGAVEVHPENPDIVLVAAIGQAFQKNEERGLFKTEDGGKTWEKILYISDEIGITDVEFAPDNPNILYAAAWKAERKPWTILSGGIKEGGLYKSTDGGATWNKLEKDLPQGLIGKADLAVSPADPDRLYALIEAPEGEGGLFRSDDRGASFKLVSTKKQLLDRPFYYCNVDVNPQNANTLYVSATQFWKSVDGGKNWIRESTPHGDNHEIWINPNDSMMMVQANDGGVNVSLNNGKSWSTQNNQPTAELYQIEVDDQFPYWVYAGQQDNTTLTLPVLPPFSAPSGSTGYWRVAGGCETGPAVPKPGNPDIVYSNCKGRFGVYNKRTGQEKRYYVGASNMYGHNPKELKYRFQRVSPIHVSPHNPDVVYHTSQFVHKTTNDGETWETISPDLTAFEADKQVISGAPITRDITGEEFYSTIYAIRESKIKEGLIWVGANDGPVHVTRDGGKNWKKVTPSSLLPGGRIDCVEPSVHQEGKAYFTSLRYQLGDWKPYIFKTEDFGNSWTLLTTGDNGIPADFPVRVVREDPDREGLLYAGTEYGLFISFDDGNNWQSMQQNLPVTPITDLKVHRKDLVISTMGRSFWILDNLTALQKAQDQIAAADAYLFAPRQAYRMRYRGNSKNSLPHYPSNGATIDYYLKSKPKGNMVLDIINNEGMIIRSFTSANNSETDNTNAEPSMATGFSRQGVTPILKTEPGLHRFRWDLRHNGVWDKDPKKSGRSGPTVAPGDFTVRLMVDGNTMEQTLTIRMDPRIEDVSQEDIVAQESLNLQITSLRSEAKQMIENIKKRRKEIADEKKGKKKKDDLEKEDLRLQEVENQLITAEGRYMKPMLLDQLRYLAYMLDAADQKPGKDAYDRFEELTQSFKTLETRVRGIAKYRREKSDE